MAIPPPPLNFNEPMDTKSGSGGTIGGVNITAMTGKQNFVAIGILGAVIIIGLGIILRKKA